MATKHGGAAPLPDDKPVEVEDVKSLSAGEAVVRHYVPATDEERQLDRRVNAKLDAVVLVILAISFIVRLPLSSHPPPEASSC